MRTEREITDRVRRWVADRLGTADLVVDSFPAGLTGTVFRVTTGSGYACVLRTLPLAAWAEEAARHIDSERIGCALLADSDLPVPTVLAADPDGATAGAPSSLTTLLPGEIRLGPPGSAAVDALARAALTVHRTPVSGERPHRYQLWSPPRLRVPEWSTDPALWQAAIDRLAAPAPPATDGLIHRDFHPGNVLWQGRSGQQGSGEDETISGVIDWAETAWGPADLDLAHCATNLAVLAGVETALELRTAYRMAGGVLTDDPYWQLADVVGFLPDPVAHLQGYLRVRTDLDGTVVRARLEALVRAVLAGRDSAEPVHQR